MTSAPAQTDVAVVGGGVIGFATAYFLATEHRLRCLVIERDGIASQASGKAAGELSPLSRVPLPNPPVQFGLEGLRLHRALAPLLMEQSGIDYQLTDMTVLRPAFTPDEVAERHQQMAWHHTIGIESSWLDATTLNSMDTGLPPETLGALSTPEAQLETYPFALALAKAAERHGVRTRIGEVTGLTRASPTAHVSPTNGRSHVTGVTLGREHVPAQLVVVASGPWASTAGTWLGYPIPVKPLKGQIVYLVPPKPLPGYAIFHESGYVLPKPSGNLMVGTTEEDVGFDREPTVQAQTAILAAAVRLVPRLAGVPIKEVTACLRPLSTDSLPFIGESPLWEGVYLATGHGRKGILLCLATGKYLAQLIAQGHSDYSLEPFSPQRLVQGTRP